MFWYREVEISHVYLAKDNSCIHVPASFNQAVIVAFEGNHSDVPAPD